MKVRFYCDVPEWHNGIKLYANEFMLGTPPIEGWKRVAFDVDFGPDVLKTADVGAVAQFVGVVPDLNFPADGKGGAA